LSCYNTNKTSMVAYDSAKSSTSIVKVITESCLLALPLTTPLHKTIIYVWKLLLVYGLLANDESI
jgi:hypothetical protein